jgi:hypothetical protein
MEKDGEILNLPNVHKDEIGEGLLKAILDEGGISVDEWLGRKDKTHGRDVDGDEQPAAQDGDEQPETQA